MSKKINPNFILSSVIGGTISAIIIGGALMLGFGISENNISDTTQIQKQQTKSLNISKKNVANSHLRSHRIKQSQNLHRHNSSIKHQDRSMKQKISPTKNHKKPEMLKNSSTTREKMNRKIISTRNTMNQKMENLLATGALTTEEYNELNTIITPKNRETFTALLHQYLEDNEQRTKDKLGDNNMRRQKQNRR